MRLQDSFGAHTLVVEEPIGRLDLGRARARGRDTQRRFAAEPIQQQSVATAQSFITKIRRLGFVRDLGLYANRP